MIQLDGTNIIEEYQLHVELGGIEEFLSLPKFKKLTEVDWHEHDSVEVDLSSPRLDAREFNIAFIYLDIPSAKRFLSDLESKQVFTFRHHTGIECKCRYVGVPSTEIPIEEVGTMVVRFQELAPRLPDTTPPQPTQPIAGELTLDGKPFSQYGVRKLRGEPELERTEERKAGLAISTQDTHGVQYHKSKYYKTKKQTAKLQLLTQGTACVRNYRSFLSQLMRAGTHTIGARKCYYEEVVVQEYDQVNDLLTFELRINLL